MSFTVTDEITEIYQVLEQLLGSQKFKIWFENSTRLAITEGYLKVSVPSQFIAGWIESHFASQIDTAVQRVLATAKKLAFSVEPELAGKREKKTGSVAKPARSKVLPVEASRPPINAKPVKKLKFTLDSFVVGRSNQLAFTAAKAVACEQKSPFNPLFIHGGYGVGKTHLLQGICNEVLSRRPGTNWLYLSAEEFANQFVLALRTKKLDAFRRRMRQTDLLAIDDIHFLAGKNNMQEEFIHTFNSIDLAGKQVVLVSDAHPKLIDRLCDQLVNRFVSGMVVKIDNPDFQTRCQICRNYADRNAENIPDNVIRYVAENIKSNARELEGAMLKLSALSALQNQKVTVQNAKQLLEEHLTRTESIVHVSDIELAVSQYFDITAAELHSSKKNRTISLARHYSMYLARKHTKMSFPEIGRSMGNKNHATVLLACKKIEDLLNRDAEIRWHGIAGNRVSKANTILTQIEELLQQ